MAIVVALPGVKHGSLDGGRVASGLAIDSATYLTQEVRPGTCTWGQGAKKNY